MRCKEYDDFSLRKVLFHASLLTCHYAVQGLEYCEERYSQELSGAAFPLRAQNTNTRLLNCQTIEKFRPHPDRDDSMTEGQIGHIIVTKVLKHSVIPPQLHHL